LRKFFSSFFLAVILLASSLPAHADSQEYVMKAMQDEMARSMTRLKLNDHPGPYFISYTITQYDTLNLLASGGSIASDENKCWRDLKVDVREGDYKLDSSNFSAASLAGQAGILPHGNVVTVEDNYDAIRHTLWLRTDAAYKTAIKNLEAKKNYLAQNNVRERPDDMSKEKTIIIVDKPLKFDADGDRWRATIKSLSAIFRQYPEIQHSLVGFSASGCNDWFVNSEGTRCREYQNQYLITVMASLQADDGMQLADSRVFAGYSESDLPTKEALAQSVKAMATSLVKLKSAPLADEYRGPILLEGQASAEFFNQVLRSNLGHAQENLASGLENAHSARRNPLKELYGRRILPEFITITDDPMAKTFKGQTLFGGYKVDDDGVQPQKIVLVDKGILKTFCTSRTPTLHTDHSNGHSVNGVGESNILFIDSSNQLSKDQLKAKLIELGKKEGLKSVMIARRLSTYDAGIFDPASMLAEVKANVANGSTGGINARAPLFLYSVSVDNGSEQLVRGAQFSALSLRLLRDIVCTGDDAKPYLGMQGLFAGSSGLSYTDLISPSVLIEEIELRKPERETDKLPYLPNPYSESKPTS